MEKLKDFLEKWQWASLEEADKTLTESEQKIWELMKKNQKLEKQLAEKEKLIGVYAVEHGMLQRKIADLVVKEIKAEDGLKRQLAEKDTQIQSQKKNLEFFYDVFNNSESYQTFSDINQAKTDFAIEQLEKMREIIDKNYFYNVSSDCCTFDKLEVDFQIDNQIKELKGEYCGNVHCESVVFATKEETQAKLEELQGESE